MEVLQQNNSESAHDNAKTENGKPESNKHDQFITVVSVGSDKDNNYENVLFQNNAEANKTTQNGFVTVLTIGDEVGNDASEPSEVVEEVLVYRLPGERLGFGLKFEGGTKTTECVRRLFIQSCAPESPASRVKCSWGALAEGDEVLKIDSYPVTEMTRLDCVRCLKDSNVVIKLLVKHCKQQPNIFMNDSQLSLHSDEDLPSDGSEDKKRGAPPPPPIPPRKMSRKLLNKDKATNPVPVPPRDVVDVDSQLMTKPRQNLAEPSSSNSSDKAGQKVQTYPKSAPRTRQMLDAPPKVPVRDRKLSDVSSGPPDAEVYLDLLAQELECGIKTESESDDTGSTISTVIDKHNSIFITSNSSSIASDSVPSTPTAVQKQMDLSKVVNPFEILEMEYASNIQPNDDFLFTRFVTSHDILLEYGDGSSNDQRSPDGEKTSLTPPANFQDAPLSYGNEDVSTITTHNSSSSGSNGSNGSSGSNGSVPCATRNTPESREEPNHISMNINNGDGAEEIENKAEEVKIPKPVPRKCYTKKAPVKPDTEETRSPETSVDDVGEFNLPRLVNFVPKVASKASPVHDTQYSFTDTDVQLKNEESDFNKLCLNKFSSRSDDFKYLYADSSEIIECNNNECEKIISCSTWSLPNHLDTIGESEEELDSLDPAKQRFPCLDYPESTVAENVKLESSLSQKEDDNIYSASSNDYCDNNDKYGQLNYANDKRKSIFNQFDDSAISPYPNVTADICEMDSSVTEKEIPAIHLQHSDDSIKEDMKDVTARSDTKDTEISDTMEVSNFIHAEQQHAITTSEYSSLSSLSSPPLSFSSRLPPDGQEFPPSCQESRQLPDNPPNENLGAPPPLPKSELPPIQPRKSLTEKPVESQHVTSLTKSQFPVAETPSTPTWVKNTSETRKFNSDINSIRNSLWKRNEISAGSVKDKIAIFSSAENSEPLLPQDFTKLNKNYKSSENINEDKSSLYSKKNKFSKSCLCVNKISNSPAETQNIPTNNPPLMPNGETNMTSSVEHNNKEKVDFEFAKPTLSHTASFSTKPNLRLHSRSQSMLDMSNLDSPWNNNSDSRRLTLNTLIEQRRRGLSKLRGLVIPQTEVPIAEQVLDLPEIRSKESDLLNKQIISTDRSKSDSLDIGNHQRHNSASLQSPSWKNNSISSLPRYSPAFKRKCLQVYVMEQSSTGPVTNCSNSHKSSDSVFHSDDESRNSTPLKSCSSEDKFDDVFSKNGYTSLGEQQKHGALKSVDPVTSPSNSEISFEYSYHSTTSNNSLDPQLNENLKSFQMHDSQNYYPKRASQAPKLKSELSRSEDDSDNDSAVSSSQSSYISRECSPLPPPLQDYGNNSHILASANAGDKQTAEKSKEHFALSEANNGLNGRVLKPQSVEAINRKNILASAKCRSGRDFKNGSPLIQRKLNGNGAESLLEEGEHVPSDSSVTQEMTKDKSAFDSNNELTEDENDCSSSSTSICPESTKSNEDSVDSPEKTYRKQASIIDDIKKSEVPIRTETKTAETPNSEFKVPFLRSVSSGSDQESKYALRTSKSVTLNISSRSTTTLPTLRKHSSEKLDRPTSMYIPKSSRYDANKRASVTDIRKQFERFEMENQKSPTYPEPKTPIAKTPSKATPPKSPVAKTPTENKTANFNTLNKDAKISASKDEPKPANHDTKKSFSTEELDKMVTEVNEGVDKRSDLYVNLEETIVVVLHREVTGGSIGITLTGGTDYEAKEITVHKVLTGSCAHKDGRLKKGDRILSINGKKMLGVTHKESIDILKDPRPEVTLVVLPSKDKTTPVNTSVRKSSSEVLTPEENASGASSADTETKTESILVNVELIKDGAGLGFSLDGGRDSPKGDKPLIIKKIFTGGAAEKCGQLQAGDELIEVNEVEVFKMTRIEVWSLMKKLPDGKVKLTIRR